MIPTITEHVFRSISIQYMGERIVSDFEREALKQYYLLHDQAWQTRELLRKSQEGYVSAREALKACREPFDTLQHEYTLLLPMLNYINGTVDLTKVTDEYVGFDTTDLMTALNTFQDLYIPLYERLNNMQAEFAVNESIWDKTEQGITAFDNKYVSPIIRDWEQMEIDSASLDEDWNNYRIAYKAIDDLNNKLYDLREEVVKSYTDFANEWSRLHADLENFFAELKKLNTPPGLN